MRQTNFRALTFESAQTLQAGITASQARPATRTSYVISGMRWTAWVLSALIALIFLWQPVGVGAQLELGLAAILAMAITQRMGKGRFSHWTFLAFGSLVILRYVYWRATQTLPDFDDVVGFSFGILLAAAELYCVVALALNLTINAEPLERGAAPCPPEPALPDVDVFIPSYDEDPAILSMTIAAALSMDYPAGKLKVWLLDDGGTDQKCADPDPTKASASQSRRSTLQKLCADLGASYLTRARNEHAKAGNLNNGLAHSAAPIVVVFDADHAPFRSFLRETVGYFADDPKLFLVQTPHVFLNPDPIERNLRTFDRMPSENEMFYSVTQRGLDKWNGSFFCGSAALLRRAALQTTGGFSGITITEDCETAFELHRAGWTSVYVDRPLIAGLQPETFASFIGQRSRWCQGMFQILLLKNPALKPGLAAIQRLAYLSSMTFWFFPLPRLLFMFAPLLHIFFDVRIFVSTLEESIAYAGTYIIVNMMVQNRIYGHVRWPLISELYEYVQGVYLAKAIVSVVVSPRKPTFKVTKKGLSLASDHLSGMAWPFFANFAILLVGVATAAWRYAFEPGVTNLMLVVGVWALFNLLIAGAALGAVAERRELRRNPRLAIARSGRIAFDGYSANVAIENVSAGGCAIRVGASELVESALNFGRSGGRLAILRADGRGYTQAIDVIPTRSERDGETMIIGLRFDAPAGADYLVLADLMYGDADALSKFLTARRKHMGLLRGILVFLRWSLCEPVRAFRYLFTRRPRPSAAHVDAPVAGANAATASLIVDAPSISPDAPVTSATVPVESGGEPGEAYDPQLWIRDYLAFAEDMKTRGYLSESGGRQQSSVRA